MGLLTCLCHIVKKKDTLSICWQPTLPVVRLLVGVPLYVFFFFLPFLLLQWSLHPPSERMKGRGGTFQQCLRQIKQKGKRQREREKEEEETARNIVRTVSHVFAKRKRDLHTVFFFCRKRCKREAGRKRRRPRSICCCCSFSSHLELRRWLWPFLICLFPFFLPARQRVRLVGQYVWYVLVRRRGKSAGEKKWMTFYYINENRPPPPFRESEVSRNSRLLSLLLLLLFFLKLDLISFSWHKKKERRHERRRRRKGGKQGKKGKETTFPGTTEISLFFFPQILLWDRKKLCSSALFFFKENMLQ